MSGLRVVLLTSDSPWQRALANRIAADDALTLVGVVVQSIPRTMRSTWIRRAIMRQPGMLAKKIVTRLFLRRVMNEIAASELDWFGESGKALDWPDAPVVTVADINESEVVRFLERLGPDVGAVSGTRIIKEPIFAVKPPDLLLNLHTGLSPYYKGGPNCTLWALSRQEPHLVGATIHVLDPGIDSGDILLTEFTPLQATDTLGDAVSRTVSHGHDMYVRVLRAIAEGIVPVGVPQDSLGEGRTFFTREWGPLHLRRASRFVRRGDLARWATQGFPRDPATTLVDSLSGPGGK